MVAGSFCMRLEPPVRRPWCRHEGSPMAQRLIALVWCTALALALCSQRAAADLAAESE